MKMDNLIVKAEKGDSEAQYQLSLLYCIKNKVKECLYWANLAAAQGHFRAIDLIQQIHTERTLKKELDKKSLNKLIEEEE